MTATGTSVLQPTLSPARQATLLHQHLLTFGPLQPCATPLPHGIALDHGETLLGVFGPTQVTGYGRYLANPAVRGGGPLVITTNPHFAAGFLLGAVVRRMFSRANKPVWRARGLLATAVTTRRLWCLLPKPDGTTEWWWFNFANVVSMSLDHDTLTVSFTDIAPLRLTGPWASWCGVVLAHLSPRIPAATALTVRRGVVRTP